MPGSSLVAHSRAPYGFVVHAAWLRDGSTDASAALELQACVAAISQWHGPCAGQARGGLRWQRMMWGRLKVAEDDVDEKVLRPGQPTS
jgi:hypothetical protein